MSAPSSTSHSSDRESQQSAERGILTLEVVTRDPSDVRAPRRTVPLDQTGASSLIGGFVCPLQPSSARFRTRAPIGDLAARVTIGPAPWMR